MEGAEFRAKGPFTGVLTEKRIRIADCRILGPFGAHCTLGVTP